MTPNRWLGYSLCKGKFSEDCRSSVQTLKIKSRKRWLVGTAGIRIARSCLPVWPWRLAVRGRARGFILRELPRKSRFVKSVAQGLMDAPRGKPPLFVGGRKKTLGTQSKSGNWRIAQSALEDLQCDFREVIARGPGCATYR